jgi:hypothetical protein
LRRYHLAELIHRGAPLIRRTRDVARVNELMARDFPGCDMSELLAEPMHVCLIDGESGAIFAFRGPGIYEAHVFFAVKGRAAIDLGHAMLDYMRGEHGARLFWALVPIESRKVQMFTRLMGWKSLGVRETRFGPQELFSSEI